MGAPLSGKDPTRLRASQKRLAEIVAASQELANTKARHTGLIQKVARLAQQEIEAKSRLAATDAQVKKAAEEVRVQSADQERESQLRHKHSSKKLRRASFGTGR